MGQLPALSAELHLANVPSILLGSVPGENQENNFAGCLTEFKISQIVTSPMSADMSNLWKLVSGMSKGAKCASSCTF